MSKVFITFGAGNDDYYAAVKRLTTQVENLQLFNHIIGYTDANLRKDSKFWPQHQEFITANKRGYGYWLWKPYLILKTLSKMEEGDVLLYADCGCEISTSKKTEINGLLQDVNEDLLYASYADTEIVWSKIDLISYFRQRYQISNVDLNSRQFQASTIMCKKCPLVMKIVNKWYKLACNYHFLDDSSSLLTNNPSFREHRHDQSIFSLLCKNYKLYGKKSLASPINIARNKTGISKI